MHPLTKPGLQQGPLWSGARWGQLMALAKLKYHACLSVLSGAGC